ncbi:MAG TPA: winged helix DNA-binding domain-containing protein [Thermomicrobiales bacterium]|nr:winged helix DNA-binding domain-containing protein [Thermomicrobiales bacterium]
MAPREPRSGAVLSRRALNRATLARQLLLGRADFSIMDAVAHLAGMQAQTPHTWYVGLWSRLANFQPDEVGELLINRQLVRIALMRSTIHLVTAADCLAWRPIIQPVLERGLNSTFGKRLTGIDRAAFVAAGRALVDERPLTFAALGARLAEQWPGRDEAALAQALRAWVPLVQAPPRGIWGRSGPIAHTSAQAWLGADVTAAPSPQHMVRRYLAAFGPATVKDIQVWSGVTRLRAVVDDLRPELVTFRDEQGQELFDLPGAPRPDPATPAPPRFLYDYDNLLLSYADRSRVITDDYRRQVYAPYGPPPQLVLIDGFTGGDWQVARERDTATLTIRPFIPLSAEDTAALAEEGARLLAFIAADAATRDVQITAPV